MLGKQNFIKKWYSTQNSIIIFFINMKIYKIFTFYQLVLGDLLYPKLVNNIIWENAVCLDSN